MKKVLRWLGVVTLSLVMAVFLFGLAVGNIYGFKGLLILKGDILGYSPWDIKHLARMDFGEEYGKFFDQCYEKPTLKWLIPLSKKKIITVAQIFDYGVDLEISKRKVLANLRYYSDNPKVFYKEIGKARGLKFLIWETESGVSLEVFQKEKYWPIIEQKWINPTWKSELERIRTKQLKGVSI